MILVTGATGHFGKATIESLLKKGIPATSISALVRDKAKAEDLSRKGITLRIGDYNDYNSLMEAFTGVDKLLLVSGNDIVNRYKQHENAIKAAKETSVKYIVYTSFQRKIDSESSPLRMLSASHILTEKLIKESGIPYTILKNNAYMEMLPVFLGEKVLENGVFFPAGETKAGFALRAEIAEATAQILTENGHENKTHEFSNSENISFADVAQMLTEITGKTVQYHNPDPVKFAKTLSDFGTPEHYVKMFTSIAEGIKQGELAGTTRDLEKLLNRKPTTVRQFLTGVYSKQK